MGLDMYLSCNDRELTKEVQSDDFYSRRGTIIYWRKANAVHKWFLEQSDFHPEEDDCRPFEVTLEDLERLRDVCQKVIDEPLNANALLPTTNGFFFGSTEYDQYYFQDVKDTLESLNAILERVKTGENEWGWKTHYYSDPDWYLEFQYCASW